MRTLLAALPIVALLALMLGARWSGAAAGAAALAAALPIALATFDLAPIALAGVLAEGMFLTATILLILWPALAIHLHQERHGGMAALRQGLARLSGERTAQGLLVGWFAGSFFEGAAGFGAPVAIAAPILVGLGYRAVDAVVLALLGHASGVAFGALGSFVTGSATASNILFAGLQAQAAGALGISREIVVAAQGAGAAIGNVVCPHNIVAGAATVGLVGREGEILRRTLPACALYLAAGGLVVTVLLTVR